ncbi:putative Actin-binding protein [Blattamonas nauphoetae]|uniref:Actin-binding protein n=1 Tax=Blattamonas nauphoetae TaxID=2049346 RepID=A0ABQ9WNM1_9EUKA|nr:putative Actin-binding protein [Blattamonas nauphoetae]
MMEAKASDVKNGADRVRRLLLGEDEQKDLDEGPCGVKIVRRGEGMNRIRQLHNKNKVDDKKQREYEEKLQQLELEKKAQAGDKPWLTRGKSKEEKALEEEKRRIEQEMKDDEEAERWKVVKEAQMKERETRDAERKAFQKLIAKKKKKQNRSHSVGDEEDVVILVAPNRKPVQTTETVEQKKEEVSIDVEVLVSSKSPQRPSSTKKTPARSSSARSGYSKEGRSYFEGGQPTSNTHASENWVVEREGRAGEREAERKRAKVVAVRQCGARRVITHPTVNDQIMAILVHLCSINHDRRPFDLRILSQTMQTQPPHLRVAKIGSAPILNHLNSWTHLSQVADDAQLLDFLANGNILRVGVDLSDICWRLKKKEVFEQVLAILEKRGVYNRDIWSYSLKHEGPIRAIEAYLSDRHNGFTRHIPKIQKIESSLYTSDPVANHAFNLYEYRPLINPRTFSLGTQKEIPNANLKQQYKQYLLFLAHRGRGHLPPTATKPLLCSDDKLIMSYYLILQDRLDEARAMFNQIPRSFGKEGRVDEEMAIQYAYMSGYLDFSTPWTDYSDDPSQHLAEARRVVAEFEHVKLRRWRDMFDELKRQLEIIDTAFLPIRRTETEDETDMILMEDEHRHFAISLNKESFDVSITQQNGKDETALVKFYPVDIELLFSLNPFIRDRGEKCSSVTPSTTLTVPLSKEGDEISETTTVAIPTEFRNRNVMISVEYETLTKTVSSFDHSMAIDVFEQAGRLQVRDRTAKRPLPSVYVKAYMRKNKDDKGEFQKDGFTDLTGTFDYASVNKETRSTRGFAGARFSILVMSHNRGSDVIEVSAPAQ